MTTPTVQGFDVSNNNGLINWAAVPANERFAFIKASEGSGFVDPDYTRNVAGALGRGMFVGAYHFGRKGDAAAQARHFATIIGKPGRSFLPPTLDLEAELLSLPEAELAAWVRTFFATLDPLTGRKTAIYTSNWVPGGLLSREWQNLVAGRLVWIADYGHTPTVGYRVWQSSEFGTVAGVGTGSVDLDVFAGTFADLQKWALVGSTPRTLKLTTPLMHGADVVKVQQALTRKGHPVTADGWYGHDTANAVLAFKKTVLWLPKNSIVGLGTRKALGL